MPGNVVVDEPETQEPAPPRMPAGWFAGLGVAVVLVLALLPGRPDTEIPPTSVTFPEMRLEEERWRPFDLPGGGALRDVAVLPDGAYVAVGDGPQVWHYDGEQVWEWVLDESAPSGTLASVTPYRSGALAVGVEEVDGDDRVPMVWRSIGDDWEREDVVVEGMAGLEGVFAAGVDVVAWGWEGSAQDYAPESRPLLLRSVDGRIWSRVDAFGTSDRLARVFTVNRLGDRWYVGGYATGRPALWQSEDELVTWTRVDTDDLPFGWAVQDVSAAEGGGEVATLVSLSEGRFRRWIREGDGWSPLDERPQDPVFPLEGGALGVGDGRLWTADGEMWEELELAGEVRAAVGAVAVGTGPDQQPKVWIQDGSGDEVAEVAAAGGGHWEPLRDLGEGSVVGAWRVADGWVIGGDPDRWWYLAGDLVEAFEPPWDGDVARIVRAGPEWVALPSMHWSDDGLEWEQRARPWEGAGGRSAVEAISESEGRLLAVGRDSEFLWNVSVSRDGGRTWRAVDRPAAATPLWDVAGTPEGFVASAARSRGTRQVVRSSDGRTWETVADGQLLSGVEPPAAVTDQGWLVIFDTGEQVSLPRRDVTGVVRGGDGVVLEAGGRLWVEGDAWEEVPLDPTHGMEAGVVDPLPLGERLLAVGQDRGRLVLYEWHPG